MQILNFVPILALALVFIIQQSNCVITKSQIEAIRKLPVAVELQDDLIEHYDLARDWMIELTLGKPRVGRASVPCLACRVVLNVYIELNRNQTDIEWIIDLIKTIACPVADAIDVLHPDVCTGALDMYKDNLHYIIDNNLDLKALDVCTILLGKSGEDCDGEKTEKFYNWTTQIVGNRPQFQEIPYLPETVAPVKILQLTDIHLDLDYEVGKNTDCGKPMCCQAWEDDGIDSDSSAGIHGDYKCDMPLSAMNELFETASKLDGYEYEFVMMTGDLPPHNIWNTTIQGNLDHYSAVNTKLLELFKVPIYPVLGNHEPHPCNLYPPQSVWAEADFDKSWMYNAIADAYVDHIKDPVAIEQFRKTGYYTIMHKDTNLRIVTINTNFGYSLNFWLYYELEDPEGQLQWLANTLDAAEKAGERVYILGHMPPGSSDCWGIWSAQFERIIVRYSSIIMGQWYGHTHNDEIEIFYDEANRPVNSLYIGASTTALEDLNPGFKVYYADGARGPDSTWEIMDHETWIYNLTRANLEVGVDEQLPWELEYKAKDAFGLRSLRPKDLDDLAYRMLFDDELFQKYYRFYHKSADVRPSCDTNCKLNYICEMVIANTADYRHCERFRAYHVIGETTTIGRDDPSEGTTDGTSEGTTNDASEGTTTDDTSEGTNLAIQATSICLILMISNAIRLWI